MDTRLLGLGALAGGQPLETLDRKSLVAIAIDALIVQPYSQAFPTEATKEMLADAVCSAFLLMERLAVNEKAEANLTALIASLPIRLQQIRNGRPVGS